MSDLPSFVEEGLLKICKASEAPWEDVHSDYLELYNDPFVQKDEQFTTDKERHEYSIAVLHTRYVSRPPMKTVTIVPIGYTGKRVARSSGNPNCTISVLIKGDPKIRRIVCRGEQADVYRKINLFHQYTVKCGEFKSGDLIADNRTQFMNPVRLNIKPAQIMEKAGVKRISIADASKFPSAQRKGQRKGRTYIDRSDWRCVRGIIVRDFRGTRDDETEYGAYTIADSTVTGEPLVLDDGTIIRPGFTVWTDPAHMVYAIEDEVDCYGPININKDGDAQMTGLLILPTHTRGGSPTMSFDDIFDQFDEEKKEDKTVPKESVEASKTSESVSVPIPEGEDKPKEESEEEAPATSEEKEVDDWFVPTEEEPASDELADDQPIEEESVKKEATEETPAEEAPAAEVLSESVDDWFEPAEEESAGNKMAEEQPVKEKAAGETPAEEIPSTETPTEVTEDWFEPAAEEYTLAETPTKVHVDMDALVGIKASPIVCQAVSAEVMKEQMKQFQSLKASLLDKGKDIATIQNKPFIKRSDWRKLALTFNISDSIDKEQKEEKGDDFEWRIWVRVTAPNGRQVVGIGACSSKERDFAHLEHDVYATAHTRAKNRALSDMIGSGEVSWEELRGFG